MPTTGDTWIALATGQILDFAALDSDFLDVVVDGLAQLRGDIYGNDTTIGSTRAGFTYALSTLDLDAEIPGTTPDGYRITADPTDAAWQSVPFADSGATTYHVGARRQLRPYSVTGNTADGDFYYDAEIEDVGELGAPDAVTDQGGGAGLYLDVDGLVNQGWTVADTRPVVVWLVNPVTGSADAIYEGTVEWDGVAGTHRITVPHYLGQDSSAPSTTAGDYRVIVRGPSISTSDLSADSGIWYLGSVASGVWSETGQNLVPTWGEWLTLFSSEHDTATGYHTTINAQGVELYGSGGGSHVRQVFTAAELGAYGHTWEQAGGGTPQAWAYGLATGTAPYHVKTTTGVGGSYSYLDVPARLPHDQDLTLTALEVGIWMQNAGASESFTLELIKRDAIQTGLEAGTVVASWTFTKPPASTWSKVSTFTSGSLPVSVPQPGADYTHLWRLKLTETVDPGKVLISSLQAEWTASRIEPL